MHHSAYDLCLFQKILNLLSIFILSLTRLHFQLAASPKFQSKSSIAASRLCCPGNLTFNSPLAVPIKVQYDYDKTMKIKVSEEIKVCKPIDYIDKTDSTTL